MLLRIKNICSRHKLKCIAALCALTVCMTMATTSMYAYLTDVEQRTAVFTIGLIDTLVERFVLLEHKAIDSNKDGLYELTTDEVISNDYKVYPGVNIPKDPFIEIEGLKHASYLFVEIVGDSNSDFNWNVNDSWEKTNLTGLRNGVVYAYKGRSQSAMPIDVEDGDKLTVYILNGIEESENGGILISDEYDSRDKVNLRFYSYLVHDSGFANYADAYNAMVQ